MKRPDEILKTLNQVFDGLVGNYRMFIGAIVAILALVLAVVMWQSNQGAKRDAARDAFFQAQKSFETEMKALADSMPPVAVKLDAKSGAKPGDKPSDKKEESKKVSPEELLYERLDADAKFPKTVAQLKVVSERFVGSAAGFEATLMLGALYQDHGDSAKALPWFEKAAGSASKKSDRALAWASVGHARENLGKHAEAVQAYQKGLEAGDASIKGELLLSMARGYELVNDKAKAKSVYDQIISQLPSTEYEKTAQTYKAKLK